MLNKIVWNRTLYLYKMDLALNNLQKLIYNKTQTTNFQLVAQSAWAVEYTDCISEIKLFLHLTEDKNYTYTKQNHLN